MPAVAKGSLLNRFVTHPYFESRESVYVRWYPKRLSDPPSLTALASARPRPRGAYIHVPFCDRLCRFCPFNKRKTDADLVDGYVGSLLREIEIYGQVLGQTMLDYVYFGGGTPSVLSAHDISKILNKLQGIIGIAPSAEVTLETHPTHLTQDTLREMMRAGVTRFSSGFQSFDDDMLKRMGAQHSSDDLHRGLRAAAAVNAPLTIDLLFRCAGQSLDAWREQLKLAVETGAPHISCYSLVLKDDRSQPTSLEEAAMTIAMLETLGEAGFRHYASCASGGFDFALPGRECNYEVRHWRAPQDEFIGLGPGALGFLAGRTLVNGLEVTNYITNGSSGRLSLVSGTECDEDELRRRYFVLGVKTLRVEFAPYRAAFRDDPLSRFARELSMLQKLDLATIDSDALILTDLGRLFVDSISSIFFSESERSEPHPEEPEIRRFEISASRRVTSSALA